jgi:oligoendopeptidase F
LSKNIFASSWICSGESPNKRSAAYSYFLLRSK